MNDITTALVKAGVKLPTQNQRIWTYLKDFGPHTVTDIVGETKIPEGNVAASLTVMVQRKMIERIARTDHKGTRINNHYAALGKQYVLLPKRGAAGRAAAAAKREEKAEAAAVPAAPVFSPAALCDDYKLSELRTLYAYLKGMFK